MNEEPLEVLEVLSWEERAVKRVLDDFKASKDFLASFHDECLDRYEHYRAPKVERNVNFSKMQKFPVPFTTEQVNTLKARVMQKLFFRNKPCSIYGQEKTDERDAEAKRELFEYQDRIDGIESKTGMAVVWAAIAGITPGQINYDKKMTTEVVNASEPVLDSAGNQVYLDDDMPAMVNVPKEVRVPKYLGSSVENIDIFDFFFTPEKQSHNDGEPYIVRSRRRPRYFDTKDYFFNQHMIVKKDGTDEDDSDKLTERRRMLGLDPGDKYFANHCIYLEWQGYYDPGDDGPQYEDGTPYKAGYYVIGVVTGARYEDILVRFDYEPFPFDGPNIIVGSFIEEQGEVIGPRFADNFHAVQHALDSVMGLWFASLKQTVKRPKVVNSDALKNPNQINTNVDETIEVDDRDDVNRVVKFIDVPNISPDLYNGLQMLRLMGQNASKIHDIAEGKAQQGVETLGEANILSMETEIGINDYIRTFERTWIQPMYEKRNAINSRYLPQEYVISIIGEKGLEWRTLSPVQIRAQVDFVCEAATRENQRGVIAQQIIQTLQPMLNVLTLYSQMGYPPQLWPRADLLLAELYDVWTWQSDKIAKILPSTVMDEQQEVELAQQLQMLNMLRMQAQIEPTQGRSADGARTPQPRNEGEAQKSANERNTTKTARMQ